MELRERHVAKHESQVISEQPAELAYDRSRLGAVGAFEVAVLDQRDPSAVGTHDVVVGADRDGEARFGGADRGHSTRSMTGSGCSPKYPTHFVFTHGSIGLDPMEAGRSSCRR